MESAFSKLKRMIPSIPETHMALLLSDKRFKPEMKQAIHAVFYGKVSQNEAARLYNIDVSNLSKRITKLLEKYQTMVDMN